jgi:glycerol-3-phosphate acyltransferase PlsY
MDDVLAVLLIGLGYVVGSIPVSVLVARVSGAPDPRTVGSGRIGSMNSLRALGRDRAGLVFMGDLLKGFVPVLAAQLAEAEASTEALVAIATVVGAWRSVFLRLHGGRGVVTAAGAMLVLEPRAVLLAAPVFLIVAIVTRYVSLASLLFTLTDTLLILLFWWMAGGSLPVAWAMAALVTGAIVWIAHADNIQRLLDGTERRFDAALLRGGSRGSDPGGG